MDNGFPPNWQCVVARIFDAAAADYACSIAPVLDPLIRDFVRSADLQQHELVLDIGTGTGSALRAARDYGATAVGIDISRAMLTQGSHPIETTVLHADLHVLPFKPSTFDTALASFALNSSDPLVALAEVWRVLISGGGFALQEWDEPDEISAMLSDTLTEYYIDDPPPDLAALRQQTQLPIPWDRVETVHELTELLRGAGFERVKVDYVTPVVKLRDADMLLRCKLAWPIRQAEVRAMPEEIRHLCLSDVRENLERHLNRDGTLDWRPKLVRIYAVKAK